MADCGRTKKSPTCRSSGCFSKYLLCSWERVVRSIQNGLGGFHVPGRPGFRGLVVSTKEVGHQKINMLVTGKTVVRLVGLSILRCLGPFKKVVCPHKIDED